MTAYEETMRFIEGFSRSGAPVRDLSRIAALMEKLGDPQDKLRFVHIAGTNGKGSVAEYLTNIFMQAGYRTGTFTSPYVLRYTDRIRLDRQDIPDDALVSAVAQIRRLVRGDEGYSQFEITFAAAMLYFVKSGAEIVVLETGMGGLLDCTNIIKKPDACVLTTIAMDHMNVLGKTLPEITAQKAGIIKPGAAVIISPKNEPETVAQIREAAAGNAVYLPDKQGKAYSQIRYDLTGTKFRYKDVLYTTRMGGAHQIDNALTAVETALVLAENGWHLDRESIVRGIAETQIPARMQVLSEDPLILLDGAHNADGIDALCSALRDSSLSPLIGIVGMTHGDASDHAAKALSQVFSRVLCVDGFAANAVNAKALDTLFDMLMQGEGSQSVALGDAMRIARSWARANHGSIVICGSLYLASWFLNEG
jgi:dihydrofolate synthase/folylpolyglutamate synthase